jgi:hypothetical protein
MHAPVVSDNKELAVAVKQVIWDLNQVLRGYECHHRT